jgi:hypothetical protein
MENVTQLFLQYRNAARSVWNLCFWPDRRLRSADNSDRFEEMKQILFEAIVLNGGSPSAMRKFLVSPRTSQIPIMVEQPRQGERNRYWDAPVTKVKQGEAILAFEDFFDWDSIGCLDFHYYRVKIEQFADHPELIGREALLEVEHADVYSER